MADAMRVRNRRRGAAARRRVRDNFDATIWNPAKTANTILGSCKMRDAGITKSGHGPNQHDCLPAELGQ